MTSPLYYIKSTGKSHFKVSPAAGSSRHVRKKPFEEKGHTFVDFPRTTDIPTLIDQAKDADAMIIANMPMPAEVIRSCPNLKFIDVAFATRESMTLRAEIVFDNLHTWMSGSQKNVIL